MPLNGGLLIRQRFGQGFDRCAEQVLRFQPFEQLGGRFPGKTFAENRMQSRLVLHLRRVIDKARIERQVIDFQARSRYPVTDVP